MIKGFMGRTHALISIALMCICIIIPFDLFTDTFGLLKNDILFFIIGLIVLVGGALLPDLDNNESSAGHTLGPVGTMFTAFMQSTSSVLWTLFHKKGDTKPVTQHRYFWHSLLASLLLILLFTFGVSKSEHTIVELVNEDGFSVFMQKNIALLFLLLLIFVAVLVGSNMVIGKLLSHFSWPILINYIAPTATIIYIFFLDMTHLRALGILLGLGYLFHVLEDCFADTGTMLLFPFPIQEQLWHRIRFIPKTVETGSITNTIIDTAAFIVDVALIIIIFVVLGGAN